MRRARGARRRVAGAGPASWSWITKGTPRRSAARQAGSAGAPPVATSTWGRKRRRCSAASRTACGRQRGMGANG
ncbi:Os01g0516625 [Oryza sativa Japonica Group]|uniref:Os01g0516625 protein n=1 Tax=Oryza sativa subsp. japonica TaxID=39947 RepID=A0A0P0V3C9_ORYSJ|nr:hypothetical protein EE612_003050 [Oryza sativa]BAS72418.1 Os01g0516625 [Oryza sativa Japonica Group]